MDKLMSDAEWRFLSAESRHRINMLAGFSLLVKALGPEWQQDGNGPARCALCNMLEPDGHTDRCIWRLLDGTASAEPNPLGIAWDMAEGERQYDIQQKRACEAEAERDALRAELNIALECLRLIRNAADYKSAAEMAEAALWAIRERARGEYLEGER